MKTGLIVVGVVILIVIIIIISRHSSDKKPRIQVAKQIKLDQLESVMEHLKNKNLEYDFFGITSNGIDCIYFVVNNGQINIEFEVMVNEQKPFVDKLKKFANGNRIQLITTTYNLPLMDKLCVLTNKPLQFAYSDFQFIVVSLNIFNGFECRDMSNY